MKIKNTTLANLSVGAISTRGAASKNYMVVPGEATLELDDALWKEEFAVPSAALLKSGNLVIVQEPALTKEEAEELAAKELAAAEALVAKGKTATKTK